MSVDNSSRFFSRLSASGAQPSPSSGESGKDDARSSLIQGFAQAGRSAVLVPQTLAWDLSGEEAAADNIWESMRRFGCPDTKSVKEEFVDEWTPSERGRTPASAPVSAPPPKAPEVAPRLKRNQVLVYDPAEVEAAKQNLSARIADRERTKQRTTLIDQMLKAGPVRTLVQPKRSWPAQLDALAQTYPNFHAVVDYLRAEFTLRAAGGKPLGFGPLVVHGPPGIGKSVFMEGLAEVLRTKFHRIQGETAQHSSCLMGTDKHWANAEAGAVFNALVLEGVANPVIYLDEIDKAGQDSERSIASALYGLLEESSAKAFRDVSMPEVKLNASHVQWVFAANDIRRVPAAIRSRWTEFEIPPMSLEDAKRVVVGIYDQLKQDFRIKGLEPLAVEDVNVLASKAPREMRMLLRRAMAKAVQLGKTRVELGSVLPAGTLAGAQMPQMRQAITPEDKPMRAQGAERLYLLLDTAIDLMTGTERVLH